VAQAAKSSKAPKSKQMKVACASNSNAVMRYVSRASNCKKSEKAITLDPSNPIDACVKLHGTQSGVRGSLGQLRAARRLPAGTVRLSPPADCPAKVQPNEIGITVPGPKKQWYCGRSTDGRLRWVSSRSKCAGRELPIWVPQGSPVRAPQPEAPAGQSPGNKAPRGSDDSATTDKDAPIAISVLANDTDDDGDPLSVESVNTNGTVGSVTPNANGTITYDPAGKFDNLKPGQTAGDNFKYKVQDNKGGKSGETRVDVTITGKNLSPKAVNDSSTTDEETAKNLNVLANDTDAEGDSLTVGSIDDTGTVGDVSAGPGNTIDYDPNNQFEDLAVGETRLDTFKYRANDGNSNSAPATVTMTLTGVNDAPTLDTTNSSASYSEGGAATPVDGGVALDDVDGDQISGATVSITSNFSGADGDALNFTNQNGISGTYNSGTGVLALTGNASVANYETALRSITYSLTSDNPSTATRTVSFKVKDQHNADSNTDTRDVTVAATNDAPVVTTTAGAASVNEDALAAVDSGLTVTDADDTNIESAQVRVSSGFQSGDDLVFVNTANISGSYNTGTGILTLTGTDTVAAYETALRSIQFRTTNDNPSSPKTIEFKVNDGDADSNAATKNVDVTNVNDAPTVDASSGSASFTEGGAAAALDSNFSVTDPDSAQLQGATVSITSNFSSADGDSLNFTNQLGIGGVYNSATGILTLSGNASVADYQTAIRSITFSNTSDNPSTATRTVSFKATDSSAADSNIDTRDVTVSAANDAPVVTTSAGATSYTEGDPATTIDGGLIVTDPDDLNLESAQVRISSGFESGDDLVFVNQNGISGVYNTGTGVLTMTGTSSVANYQTALRSIQYRHTGNNPSSGKVVEFKLNDGDVDSNLATKSINITGVNDGPLITTTAAALSYTEGDGPVTADSGLTLDDPENDQINSATVQITGNFNSADDELAFVNTASITGVYNDTTGLLTLTGTDTEANYQAALRSVTYENVNQNPSGSKTLSYQATDNGSPNQASNTATRDINLSNANDAPVVTTSAGNTSYTEGDPATTIDGGLTVSDVDDTNLEGGQVRVSSGFESGDDLVFVNQNGISGLYNSGTGVLTLTGTSSVANYQTALRSIQYRHTGDNPATSKVVEFKVNDGDVDSNLDTKTINITRVNDGPAINTSAGNATFTEDTSGPVAVDPNATLTDPDSTQIQGATVTITGNHDPAEDELLFVDTANITGVYNSGTGVLTLSGTDTVANYQAALRSVQYNNSDTVAPSTATRTISFQATDAEGAASNIGTRDVTVQSVNDAPVVTPTNGSTAYTEGDPATTIDGGVTISDQDDTNLEGGQVRISSGFQSGDNLVFVNQNGISGVYNTGVLTLTGTSSVANYQTALRSIQYQSTNNNPVTSKTVEFKVNDGDADSNLPTKEIAVTPVNSAPQFAAGGTLTGHLGPQLDHRERPGG
jgi:hypothetical protein